MSRNAKTDSAKEFEERFKRACDDIVKRRPRGASDYGPYRLSKVVPKKLEKWRGRAIVQRLGPPWVKR